VENKLVFLNKYEINELLKKEDADETKSNGFKEKFLEILELSQCVPSITLIAKKLELLMCLTK
jgi:hypothetical protein